MSNADFVRNGSSFAIETTLSGRGYVRLIKKWKDMGYAVTIFFLDLPEV